MKIRFQRAAHLDALASLDEKSRTAFSLAVTAVRAGDGSSVTGPVPKGLLRAGGKAKTGVALWSAVVEWGSIASG